MNRYSITGPARRLALALAALVATLLFASSAVAAPPWDYYRDGPNSALTTGGWGTVAAAVSQDGKLATVSNSNSNTIAIYQRAGDGTLTAVPGSPFPSNCKQAVDIKFKPGSSYIIAMTCADGGGVETFALDSSGHPTLDSGGVMVPLSTWLPTSGTPSELGFTDFGNELVATMAGGTQAQGNVDLFSVGSDGTLTLDSSAAAPTDHAGALTVQPFSTGGTGNVSYVGGTNGTIEVYSVHNTTITAGPEVNGVDGGASVSGLAVNNTTYSGDILAAVVGGNLYQTRIAGNTFPDIFHPVATPGNMTTPVYSPDNTKIAVGSTDGIYVANVTAEDASGTTSLMTPTRMAVDNNEVLSLTWTPDGSQIVTAGNGPPAPITSLVGNIADLVLKTDNAQPTCAVTPSGTDGAPNPNPNATMEDVTVQDNGPGLGAIDNINIYNGTVSVPGYTVGTNQPIQVTATRTSPDSDTIWWFVAHDVLGLSKACS